MAQMKDSEGANIPSDIGCRPYFHIDMVDWNNGKGPDLSLGVPEYFENSDGSDFYESAGCVTVPLIEVMDEYLDDMLETDGGEGAGEFIKYLETYIKQLREKIQENTL